MVPETTMQKPPKEEKRAPMDVDDGRGHSHRTAKVVELIGTSSKSFEDAILVAMKDAAQTTRGITGAHVENFSVRVSEGHITEYKVNLKVAFGIERTSPT